MKFKELKDVDAFYNDPDVCNPHVSHIAAILLLTEKLRDQDTLADDLYTQIGALCQVIDELCNRVELLELWIDNPEAMEWGKKFEACVHRTLPEGLINEPTLNKSKKNHKKKGCDND